jgi:valine--pyruvate aminotransferase
MARCLGRDPRGSMLDQQDVLLHTPRTVYQSCGVASPMELSNFGRRFCGESGIGELMQDLDDALATNPDMIFMGGGNPGRVPGVVSVFRQRMQRLLADDQGVFRTLGVYQGPQGDAPFRRELAAMLRNECGWQVGPDNIAIANGSQAAFFTLFNMLAGEFPAGRRKHIELPLVPEYIGYSDIGINDGLFRAERPLIELLPDRLFKYRVDFSHLAIDANAGAICVSRPTNPTANLLTDEEIARLDALAHARGIPLIIDSAYGAPFPDIVFGEAAPHWNDNTVVVLSLSKLGLPGVRTGIVVAREEITAAFARANTILNLACGTVGPALGCELLRDGALLRMGRETIMPFYRERAERALHACRHAFDGLPYRIHKPEGAFFLWLWFEGLPGGTRALYQRLKQRGALVVPGWSFFPGIVDEWPHRDECIRVSYAQEPEQVARGIGIIADELRRSYAQSSR